MNPVGATLDNPNEVEFYQDSQNLGDNQQGRYKAYNNFDDGFFIDLWWVFMGSQISGGYQQHEGNVQGQPNNSSHPTIQGERSDAYPHL
mmetsp:Transcript_23649/g.20106  ORF Transcript_23649/g.20106 Transcript_23649/m.20106 type:complete len:89 (-) Transcript_23649:111-377(-)